MKRHPALQPLSRDHHHALVLARRLIGHAAGPDRADSGALRALAAESRRTFDGEIEPHLGVEERWLLPAMERAGELDLVRRTRADHAELRTGMHGEWTAATPDRLGTLLERHVRFEERVMFVRAEEVLSTEDLEAVRAAAEGAAEKAGA